MGVIERARVSECVSKLAPAEHQRQATVPPSQGVIAARYPLRLSTRGAAFASRFTEGG